MAKASNAGIDIRIQIDATTSDEQFVHEDAAKALTTLLESVLAGPGFIKQSIHEKVSLTQGFDGEFFYQIRTWVDWLDGYFNGHDAILAFKSIHVRIAGPDGPRSGKMRTVVQ